MKPYFEKTTACSLQDYYDACGDLCVDFSGSLQGKVQAITDNSSTVKPGSLFIAIHGNRVDGRDFIHQASAKGAIGVGYCGPALPSLPIPSFRVSNDREALAKMAAFHHQFPGKKIPAIGITGTNGKTTISFLLKHILSHARKNVGLVGTIGYEIGDKRFPLERTTPDPLRLHQILDEMQRKNVQFVVMEISSHGLHQRRLDGILFAGVVFSNLSWDHLDYHHTMEAYYQTKKMLFTRYRKSDGKAIINLDNSYGKRLYEELTASSLPQKSTAKKGCIGYGVQPNSWCYPTNYAISPQGIKASILVMGETFDITSPLVGLHNLSNILAAVSTSYALGIPSSAIQQGIASCQEVPGRLHCLCNTGGIQVYIDYAHTPEALKFVLTTLKKIHPEGRCVVVFGCGGDRDQKKRYKMGKIAALLADRIILTNDNPRGENPESIIKDIEQGITHTLLHRKQRWCSLINRKGAIEKAITTAKPFDTILIAGKGHEDYQEIQGKKYPFDDKKVCRDVLRSCGYLSKNS